MTTKLVGDDTRDRINGGEFWSDDSVRLLDCIENGERIIAEIKAERDEVRANLARVTAERDELRAIVEGRKVAPSLAEIAAHYASGGSWVHSDAITGTYADNDAGETAACCAEGDGLARRWLPLDANGRPVAWPKVTP